MKLIQTAKLIHYSMIQKDEAMATAILQRAINDGKKDCCMCNNTGLDNPGPGVQTPCPNCSIAGTREKKEVGK